MFELLAKTHAGAVRDHNEDAFYCDEANGLAIIADGMGGYAAGEVASAIIVDAVAELKPGADGLVAALVNSHHRITAHAQAHPASKGMGAAVVAAKLSTKAVSVCWAGDARAYLFNAKAGLKPVSRDHSFVQLLLSQGKITEREARVHPDRNLVTQCLGINPPQPELTTVAWQRGDILLLCSDGLTDELDDESIAGLLRNNPSAAAAVDALVDAALAAGGRDNITVLLAKNLALPEESAASASSASQGGGNSAWKPIAVGIGAALLLTLVVVLLMRVL